MTSDCCKDMIVVRRKRRPYPRVTEKDFQVLVQIRAQLEHIEERNAERRFKLGLVCDNFLQNC